MGARYHSSGSHPKSDILPEISKRMVEKEKFNFEEVISSINSDSGSYTWPGLVSFSLQRTAIFTEFTNRDCLGS